MRISIVVPAFNEEKLITASLREIKNAMTAFLRRGWSTELIVCDNNSTDRTADIARAEGAIVVFEPVNQIARARNRGAEIASGNWLVFIDADTHPDQGLFEDVSSVIESGSCLAGGSTVKLADLHPVGRVVTGLWNLMSRSFKWAAGSFIFCETGAFRETGGFSMELFASEEIDLSRRLKKLGRIKGKSFIILHRNPVLTSARRVHMYSWREHLQFLSAAVAHPTRTVRSRESCARWYDGRR
jgi:glycosyltransferase involved in cell wall biosynthesis